MGLHLARVWPQRGEADIGLEHLGTLLLHPDWEENTNTQTPADAYPHTPSTHCVGVLQPDYHNCPLHLWKVVGSILNTPNSNYH